MSENGKYAASSSRSDRAVSVASHHSQSSSSRARKGEGDDPEQRRRREEDREFERAREKERERERGYGGDRERDRDREYDRDRSDRGGDRRRRGDYDDRDDDEYHRHKSSSKRSRRDERSRSRDRDHRRGSSSHYDDAPPPPRRDDRRSRRGDDYEDHRSRRRHSPAYDDHNRRASPPRRGARSPSPGISEEQREMRSVFVNQIAARITDRELGIFFEANAGKVRDARVIVDRISRRSKGVGYVEFVELESVQKALTLSGTKLLGIPLIVQYTEAEKNRQARDNVNGGGMNGPMNGGLYVGSLNFALTSEDIREVFQPFGELETVELHRDPLTGKSKGYCFVKFKEHKDAMVAIEKMNNFPLAGREIKVGLVADRSATFNKHLTTQQDPSLQLEENGGNPGGISRYELMQKLAGVDRAPELPPQPMFRPNIPQNTTRNVLMKDAFNPEEETERDWDLELADDVKSECEDKYGKVLTIFVVKESQGEIYIRFEKVEDAVKATQGLNGRWFGGRQISANHVGDSMFDANVVKK
ncbi:uncharacterized protein JCM15063_000452 [Sporobolomyces koalae]|uniref:uncharacterized protein n=1 Tax=Sporobolomyces koalae TaxID=500713 RepID=UPI003177FE3A